MVLIGGTTLSADVLPLSDLIEYEVVKEPVKLNMYLRTMAKSASCVKVYLHMSQKDITLIPEVDAKVEYYNDDEELISLLQNSDDGSRKLKVVDPEDDDLTQMEKEDEPDPTFDDIIPKAEPDSIAPLEDKQEDVAPSNNKGNATLSVDLNKGTDTISETEPKAEAKPELIIPTVDTDLPDSIFVIPDVDSDVDKLKMTIHSKDEIIKAKDAMIMELKAAIDEMYATQEKDMKDVCDTYQKTVDDANETIARLKEVANASSVSEAEAGFLKFQNYAKNYKGALREGISEDDRKAIKCNSKISIFAAGAGDSLFTMMGHVVKLVDSRDDIVFVDFTNTNYLMTKYRWHTKGTIFNVLYDGLQVDDILQKAGKAHVISATVFNDIALLDINWVDLINKVASFAKGKQIVFLLGNINTFSVRYVAEKLATLGTLNIFAKASPLILTSTFSDLKFLPNNKVKLIILDYIDVVKAIVTEINKSYAITAFSKSIAWEKLGIK